MTRVTVKSKSRKAKITTRIKNKRIQQRGSSYVSLKLGGAAQQQPPVIVVQGGPGGGGAASSSSSSSATPRDSGTNVLGGLPQGYPRLPPTYSGPPQGPPGPPPAPAPAPGPPQPPVTINITNPPPPPPPGPPQPPAQMGQSTGFIPPQSPMVPQDGFTMGTTRLPPPTRPPRGEQQGTPGQQGPGPDDDRGGERTRIQDIMTPLVGLVSETQQQQALTTQRLFEQLKASREATPQEQALRSELETLRNTVTELRQQATQDQRAAVDALAHRVRQLESAEENAMVVARDPQARQDVVESMLDIVRGALTASRAQDDRTQQISLLSQSVDGLTQHMQALTRQVRSQDADLQHSKTVAASLFSDIQGQSQQPRKRRSVIQDDQTDVFRNPQPVGLLQAPGDFTTSFPQLPAPVEYKHERDAMLTYQGYQAARDQQLYDAAQYWKGKAKIDSPDELQQEQMALIQQLAQQGDGQAIDTLRNLYPDQDPRMQEGGGGGPDL